MENVDDDLRLLIERAAELKVPVEVRRDPAGPKGEGAPSLHAHVGALPPDPAIDSLRLDDSLSGEWFRVEHPSDLELAATLRHRKRRAPWPWRRRS